MCLNASSGVCFAQPVAADNQQVVGLSTGEKRLSGAELLAAIGRAQKPAFDVSALGLRALKEAGVPDAAIVAVVQKKGDAVDNQTLIVLSSIGVGSDDIVRLVREIEASRAKFDATTVGIANLTGSGVERAVVRAVVRKMNPIIDSDEDLPVFVALGARITGGAIIGNAPFEVIPGTPGADGTPGTPSIRSQQYSQAASYLAFEAQPLWHASNRDTFIRRFALSPILNVRLTSIAVAEISQVAAPNGDFLKTQKAVQFQFGGLLDYHFRPVTIDGSNFRWALGGIYRQMPQSVTDSQRATRIWNIHDDLYEAWTGGLRLSLYQETPVGATTRWRPVAYIDASVGKFENYETVVVVDNLTADARVRAESCLARPSDCFADPPPQDAFDANKEARWYLESRIMLKYIYVGFDLNSGNGRDDVRFIAGLTTSLDRFFGSGTK